MQHLLTEDVKLLSLGILRLTKFGPCSLFIQHFQIIAGIPSELQNITMYNQFLPEDVSIDSYVMNITINVSITTVLRSLQECKLETTTFP